MKIALQIISLFFVANLIAQTGPAQNQQVYSSVESSAEFPGGVPELMKFIQTNLKYPASAINHHIGGKAFLRFVVTETGGIESVQIIKSTGQDDMDKEAVRVVTAMPKWKAGTVSGEAVKCYFHLPITFTMAEPYFVLDMTNKNDNYLLAKDAILSHDLTKAMTYFHKDTGDVAALYNLGVIYYLKKDKAIAKDYFENVMHTSTDASSLYFTASETFLAKNF